MIMRKGTRLASLVGASLIICSQSFAALYVIPSANTSAEASSSDDSPLGSGGQHFQQVYSSSLLAAVPTGMQIVGLTFRIDNGGSALPAQVVSSFDIRLSQSVNAPGSLSATFAANRGVDDTLVRSGPLVINAGDFPGGSSPNGFGIIPFDTPYDYNGGNLLIEIAHTGFSQSRNADAVFPGTVGQGQTAFANSYAATTANVGFYTESIVIGLQVEPIAPVPEPIQASLIGVGFLAGAVLIQRVRGSFRKSSN